MTYKYSETNQVLHQQQTSQLKQQSLEISQFDQAQTQPNQSQIEYEQENEIKQKKFLENKKKIIDDFKRVNYDQFQNDVIETEISRLQPNKDINQQFKDIINKMQQRNNLSFSFIKITVFVKTDLNSIQNDCEYNDFDF